MDCVTVRGLSFSYPGQDGPVLRDVSFSLEKGEFAVLCGPSGCGKSTLLRQLKSVLAPHGDLQGEILFEGRPLQFCRIFQAKQHKRFLNFGNR